jgi:hypothetical protein
MRTILHVLKRRLYLLLSARDTGMGSLEFLVLALIGLGLALAVGAAITGAINSRIPGLTSP